MAYIGKTPTIGNFQVCDAISVVNNQAAYTMQVGTVNVSPESANHMIVSLNGVIQKPTDAFTVSGSTITFASNLVTGDVIDFIQILGNVLDLGVPSDNTVTTAKLSDSSVSLAKLTATGTKNSTTFLRGDNTFAALAAAGVSDSFQTTGSGGSATISGALAVPNELHDDGGNYDPSNGRYTAPSTGYYLFVAAALISGSGGTSFYFTKNGSNTYGTDNFGYNGAGNQNQLNAIAILPLSSGDYINIYSSTAVYKNQFLNFGGCKLY